LKKKINVGVGFVTGRKNFKNVVKTYVDNWNESGHVDNKKMLSTSLLLII